MIHTYDLQQFFTSNWTELRRLAGAVLRQNFNDDDISDFLADLALDMSRLELLKKYDPEACKKHGVALSTVIYRQFKNILDDQRLYRTAKKRVAPVNVLEPQHAWDPDKLYEALAVREFISRLEPALSELVTARLSGFTGAQYAAERGLHRMAAVKRTLKIREKWIQYAEN